ncbi:hypothetical protein K432DRAFT_302448, partial [Lepidopterella palustris CBS 459.81]
LAKTYLLDLDTSVQVIVGLDIKYGKKGLRKATLSARQTYLAYTTNRDKLRVV